MKAWLSRSLFVSAIALGATVAHAAADTGTPDSLRWRSVIGIIQGGNVVGSGTGAVTGAPGPWSAQGGHVAVDLKHSRISFDVRNLVFAAGNTIGNTGPVDQVKGTLVCDTNGSATGGNSVLVDTPLVDLDDEGNAYFSGNVTLPAICATEPDVAFLIRVGSGRWIGNGVVLR